MLVEVNEPVEVVTVFKKNKVWPALIKWGENKYRIRSVDMIHQIFDGDTRIHYFSVSDAVNSFKLAFNTKNLSWNLEQVYYEG